MVSYGPHPVNRLRHISIEAFFFREYSVDIERIPMGCRNLKQNSFPDMLRKHLECLYESCNRREYVHPDPLEFLYRYDDLKDREIVGLIASSLAYGRVGQILKTVESILDVMKKPSRFLARSTKKSLANKFGSFKYRFTTGTEFSAFLWGIKIVLERYESLEACFLSGFDQTDDNVIRALCRFTTELMSVFDQDTCTLLPAPHLGSACKRLHLFLRWMVRRDDVDPGGWDSIPCAKLIVPLDVHMHRLCQALGFTDRKNATKTTALEVTSAFREIRPDDPVRFDFALTRLGIRNDMNPQNFLESCKSLTISR